MQKRKITFARWFKTAPIFIEYALIIIIALVGVLVFALCYSGGGARMLSTNTDIAAQGTVTDIAVPDPVQSEQQATHTDVPAKSVYRSGRFIPYLSGGLWGYKNIYGDIVIAPAFSSANEFEGDVAFAAQNGLFGLINRSGEYICPPVWTGALGFSDGRAAVEKDGKWGFIDETGALVIDYLYREAGSYSCGRAAVRSASAFAYIDTLGNTAIGAKWRKAGVFSADMAFVVSDEYTADRNYIINKVGEKIATLGSNTSGVCFSEGFAVLSSPEGYYFINAKGASAFGTIYSKARNFSSKHAAVCVNGLWGYINDGGVITIAAQYADAADFSGSYAAVKDVQSSLWGYINAAGKYVIEPKFDSAEPFSGGVAIVSTNGCKYILNTDGELVLLY